MIVVSHEVSVKIKETKLCILKTAADKKDKGGFFYLSSTQTHSQPTRENDHVSLNLWWTYNESPLSDFVGH